MNYPLRNQNGIKPFLWDNFILLTHAICFLHTQNNMRMRKVLQQMLCISFGLFPSYHKLELLSVFAILFTVTSKTKFISELNSPTAVEKLNCVLIRPVL